MRTIRLWVLLTALVASACGPGGLASQGENSSVTDSGLESGESLSAGDHEFDLRHGGLDRSYFVHVPSRSGPGPVPVVIALHGGGGTAAQLKSEIGLDAIADREGFVAVYPDGTGPIGDLLHTWNAGFNCCGAAQRKNVDDVGFVRAVVADLAKRTGIDAERVAVTGHSNGAILAYRVAAEAADLVSVAAPVAGAMALEKFAPSGTVAIFHIHSADDPRALYEGGEGLPFPGTSRTAAHEAVLDGLRAWAAVNGCEQTWHETEVLDDGAQSLSRFEYDGCDGGARVSHVRLSGVGHGWPGVTTGRDFLVGPSTTLLDASEEVWAFASSVWAAP